MVSIATITDGSLFVGGDFDKQSDFLIVPITQYREENDVLLCLIFENTQHRWRGAGDGSHYCFAGTVNLRTGAEYLSMLLESHEQAQPSLTHLPPFLQISETTPFCSGGALCSS